MDSAALSRTIYLALAVGLLANLSAGLSIPAAVAKDRTKSFPMNRESGGSRDPCESRRLAHLVPSSGRFAPGPGSTIALLEGTAPRPTPLVVKLGLIGEWTLAARPTGVRLLTIPAVSRGLLWESFPLCGADMESATAPPARTWLEPPTPSTAPRGEDRQVTDQLRILARACGTSVATAPLLGAFSLQHLAEGLPAQLPVRCEPLEASSASGSGPSISSQISTAEERPDSALLPQQNQRP